MKTAKAISLGLIVIIAIAVVLCAIWGWEMLPRQKGRMIRTATIDYGSETAVIVRGDVANELLGPGLAMATVDAEPARYEVFGTLELEPVIDLSHLSH